MEYLNRVLIQKLKRQKLILKLLNWLGAGFAFKIIPYEQDKFAIDRNKSGKVISIFHSRATDGTSGRDNINLNKNVVKQMVDEGIKIYTGIADLKKAWAAVIPDPSKKIAIKVNCQVQSIFTKEKVVRSITDGLILRGVHPANIIVYDRRNNAFDFAGFKKNLGLGIKVGTVTDFGGFSRFFFDHLANLLIGGYKNSILNFIYQLVKHRRESPLKDIILRILSFFKKKYDCEYIINVPVLKALDGCSGVTLSMKNHYGSISNPSKHHEDVMDYLPYLNNLPPIKNKTRLIVMDAMFCEYKWQNGRNQQYVSEIDKIIISKDPVAIDYVGWKIIEEERKKHDIPPLSPKPIFIENAEKLGLGSLDPQFFNHVEFNLEECR